MEIQTHVEGCVEGPGLYDMPAKVYHADPAPEPSLSSTIARLLISNSPQHAFCAHPRLSPTIEEERDPTRPKEIGTAAHKLILGRGGEIVIVDADDYKKPDTRTERKRAYENGDTPVLRPDCEKAEALANRVATGLDAIAGCEGFATAPSEVAAIVRDKSGVWLRIMMDRVEFRDRDIIIWDVKTGDQSAAPQGLGRRVENMGMEVQAAFYVRVLETLFPRFAGRIRFRWIFIENDAPHALTVAEADNVGMGIGARKVDAALHLWGRCLRSGTWPGYPSEIVRFDYPEWAAKRWTEREELDPQLTGVSYDVAASPFRPLNFGDAA